MRSRITIALPFLLLWATSFLLLIIAPSGIRAENQEEEEAENYDDEDLLDAVDCVDLDDECAAWASTGECENNPRYMLDNCKRSCRNCFGERSKRNPLISHDPRDYKDKGRDLGVPQQLSFSDGTREQDIHWLVNKARNYMKHVAKERFGEGIEEICKNQHEHCAWWALLGECEGNPEYMLSDCAPMCTSCEYRTIQGRCPLDPDAIDAWGPGDLNKMFERLTSEPYKSHYEVEILSSPATDGPWVITMENVVSVDESVRLIELGHEIGYERSSDVGAIQADGTYSKSINDGRTSTNAWCDYETCMKDEHAIAVMDRIEEITGIPEANSEHLQLLRYEKGQHYQQHHDYIGHNIDQQGGVRILTVFLYLNDVPEGGWTHFDRLDIKVAPKRGRAVVWPNVLNDDPNKKDRRTSHQALPVMEGVKYGANAWLHMRDFKTPHANGCMG